MIIDNINDSFNCPILMGDCVGSPYYCTALNNVIKAKAETINDEIYVYYYVYELIENPNTNSCSIYNIHNKENISEIKNTKCKDNSVVLDNIEIEIDSLRNESKLPIYKVIYKKQSDGKYYFTKGEWQ